MRGCDDDSDTEGDTEGDTEEDTEGLGLNPGTEAERDRDPETSGDFVCCDWGVGDSLLIGTILSFSD